MSKVYKPETAKRYYIRRAVNLLMRDCQGNNADLIPSELQAALIVCRAKYGKVSTLHPVNAKGNNDIILICGEPAKGKTVIAHE